MFIATVDFRPLVFRQRVFVNRNAIEQCVPHRGSALWLEAVSYIDADRIEGVTTAHCLAAYGEHSSSCLLYEAAAQLCAVHGARLGGAGLVGEAGVQQGFVAKAQQLQLHQPHAGHGAFTVQCQLLTQNAAGALYQFQVNRSQQAMLSGRLLLVIAHA